jgi:hypothetical protein
MTTFVRQQAKIYKGALPRSDTLNEGMKPMARNPYDIISVYNYEPIDNSWKKNANCLDAPTEAMFPVLKSGDSSPKVWQKGLAYCQNCPVKQECLEYTLYYEEKTGRRFGVWGGLTPRQRDRYVAEVQWTSRTEGTVLGQ